MKEKSGSLYKPTLRRVVRKTVVKSMIRVNFHDD